MDPFTLSVARINGGRVTLKCFASKRSPAWKGGAGCSKRKGSINCLEPETAEGF